MQPLNQPSREQELEFLLESNAIEGVRDAQSLDDALMAWLWLMEQERLTPWVVMYTHKILMKNQVLEKKHKGQWRDCEVYIGGRLGFPHKLVPTSMANWCLSVMRKPVDATERHILYEKIHPFADGNGRTGRMFLNWTRIKRNEEPLWIFKEEAKDEYYKLFR